MLFRSGARYGIPHGMGNAVVLPQVLIRLKNDAEPELAEIARHCGIGASGDTESALAQKVIDTVIALNAEIGIPTTFEQLREADIDQLVDAAMAEGSGYPTPRYFERDECEALLRGLMA